MKIFAKMHSSVLIAVACLICSASAQKELFTEDNLLRRCGLSEFARSRDLKPELYAHGAAIVELGSTMPSCFGSIISNYSVLTSAKCTEAMRIGEDALHVKVGATKIDGTNSYSKSIKVKSIKRSANPVKPTDQLWANDFAVLQLEEAIQFRVHDKIDGSKSKICLSEHSNLKEGESLTLFGWDSYDKSLKLKAMKVNSKLCKNLPAGVKFDASKMICMEGVAINHYLGSPVVAIVDKVYMHLAGIVSYRSADVTIASKVSASYPWINDFLKLKRV